MRIRFVHVPDRHETGRGAYDADIASMLDDNPRRFFAGDPLP